MSAPALPVDQRDPLDSPAAPHKPRVAVIATSWDVCNVAMRSLASLKLTVGLMAYAILVVYVGTTAQKEADIGQIVHSYFHAWLMWVDVNLFFPKEFFWFVPTINLAAPESLASLGITNFHTIPLPGGLVVGVLMAVNLLAAHGWRFKTQAHGNRLISGLGVIAAGLLIALLIILTGHNTQGFQAKPAFTWESFWTGFLLVSALLWGGLAIAFGIAVKQRLESPFTWVHVTIYSGLGIALAGLATLLWWGLFGDQRPADEALRIVWQLLQGSLAAFILLVGCILVFRKRGGIVLLHAGVGLLIFNELFVAMTARERQITLDEGQTTNCLRDIRTNELAIVVPIDDKHEEHVVIPRQKLVDNARENVSLAKNGKSPVYISDPKLPLDVAVIEYHANATVEKLATGEKTIATKGIGLQEKIVPKTAAKGTDTGGAVDLAAAYVKFAERGSGKDLGTYLLTQLAAVDQNPSQFAEKLTLGGTTYDLYLRFKHEYKPYSIKLIDVRKDDYVASDTPRNYSSDIHIKDPEAGIDQAVHIKMNDPLRYRGDTFYQADWFRLPNGTEGTRLSVVLNRAWMIPYVACMAVVIGMVAHLLITVTRFIARRDDEERTEFESLVTNRGVASVSAGARGGRRKQVQEPLLGSDKKFGWAYVILPVIAALVFALYVQSAARLPRADSNEFDFYRFGQLPVAHLGRVKPLDSLARDNVRAISGNGRETIKLVDGKRIPAIQWFLEVASGTERARTIPAFRIDSKEVRRLFDLPDRSGYMYSLEELRPHFDRFEQAALAAKKTDKDSRTVEQRRILELDMALQGFVSIARSFGPPDLPRLPPLEELKADPRRIVAYKQSVELALLRTEQEMRAASAPRLIPLKGSETLTPENSWLPYPVALGLATMQNIGLIDAEPDPLTLCFTDILQAYADGDVKTFNQKVTQYQGMLDRSPPPLYHASEVAKESRFNAFSPFYVGMPLYVMAFLLALFGWLCQYKPLNWAALTMVLLTFGLHTVALWWRMDISGRPPVTNLYSSAIFIGWAGVLFGLVMEAIFRLGLGNIVASVAGFATLLIAYLLSWSGEDNVGVMVAVLDTQFWLATHVVCITLGYSATYLAGLLGLLYVIFGMFTPLLNARSRKDLGRMIYGVTCFALLFSFYGTVLGGLWADDSWGRFWGWDPKENGALIIVLWNALVLHARWDKMIADRGLAVLALGGNIVTSWSWFGVNQLGIGLHSYGFTSGIAVALVVFGFSQLALMLGGLVPTRLWWSYSVERSPSA